MFILCEAAQSDLISWPQAVSGGNSILSRVYNSSQDVSDTSTLPKVILSYGQQDVCELHYHLFARCLKGQQAVSVMDLLHI